MYGSGPRSRTSPELTFAVGFACGLVALAIVHALLPSSFDRDVELVRAVRDLATETYVEEVDSREMVDDALRGLVGGLDRYSRYYGPAEIEQIERETSGEYRGIGVVFRDADSGEIRFPLPNSPAERAGLRVGDRILSVDGARVADMPAGGLRESLKRSAIDEIELEVEGRDGVQRSTRLTPEDVVDPTIRHARMLDAALGIGYVAILSFSHRTPDEFDECVDYLEGEGLRALIIDLRSNPGGILDAAIRIADRFIEEGTIVSTRTRVETRSSSATRAETSLAGLPLVVLVDGDSASASEVLVGALQDHRVAVIAGEPTYGKGAVQTLSRFERDNAIVKLTTSNYFTPAGRRIEHGDNGAQSGIAPDVLVQASGSVRRGIHDFLRTYSPPPKAVPELRRWEREEGIELIAKAPPDPQLDVALGLLRGESPAPASAHHAD